MRFIRLALAVLALCIPLAAAAQDRSAQDRSAHVDADAAAIFDRVMSPYCPGRTLATCGSSAADDLRDEVREQLASGRSAEDVEAGLYRSFGDSIRAEPKAIGIGLVAWLFPGFTLVMTGAWLVRRIARVAAPAAEESLEASPEMLERLDDELASL